MFRLKTSLPTGATLVFGVLATLTPAQDSNIPQFFLQPTPNPSFYGDVVTLTAAIEYASLVPGTITFTIDGTVQAISPVVPIASPLAPSGAQLTISNLSLGLHAITATYSGNRVISPTSMTIYQTVDPPAAKAQFKQQGPKLVGSGWSSPPLQGQAVALSADGNTALVGGYADTPIGGAWLFARSGGDWSQQGGELIGSGATITTPYGHSVGQGMAVALSGDGNTALIGAPQDNNGTGAAWVFTRSNSAWIQQGSKLVGSGAIARAWVYQGSSVALSADGNTALIGGPYDNNLTGAVWVFTRSGSAWSQQGGKLVGVGVGYPGWFGSSVALAADGNTALAGGLGGVWIFTRSNGAWSQQGSELAGPGAARPWSVALSNDGNTALVLWGVGEPSSAVSVFTRSGGTWIQQGVPYPVIGESMASSADGNTILIGDLTATARTGTARVFVRSGNTWSQRGTRMTGSDATYAANQGSSVALSADGQTALVGASGDSQQIGASWVFVAPSATTIALSSTPNPSLSGQAVTFTATVTAGATGTVTFTIDGAPQAPVTLNNGLAQITVSNLAPGSHTISAAYSGDANFIASTSSTVTQDVNRPPLTLTLVSAPNPCLFGQAVTFTATLSDGTGDYVGSVQFLDGSAVLGAGTVVNGQASFTTTTLSPGSHSVTAQYQRIWIWGTESAQGSVTQVVRASLTLTLTSGPNPSVAGQVVTFTAILSGGTGDYAGAVQFFDGRAALGSGTVLNGQAVFATSALTAGSHAITARYERQWIGSSESAQGSLTQVVREPIRLSSAAAPIGSAFAPDETVSLFNVTGLNGDVAAPSLPLTTSLGGVTVTITDSAGVARQAPIYGVFASAGQVNFVVPGDTAPGPASLTIGAPGGITVVPAVNIQRVAAGIFTASANGQGVYAGQIVHAHADGTQTIESSATFDSSKNAYVANPVNFGAADDQVYLVLYGTGIRHRTGDASVTAAVNGVSVTALTAAQGTWPGLDQVNLALPRSLAGAGKVDIVITVEGQAANGVAVMIQ